MPSKDMQDTFLDFMKSKESFCSLAPQLRETKCMNTFSEEELIAEWETCEVNIESKIQKAFQPLVCELGSVFDDIGEYSKSALANLELILGEHLAAPADTLRSSYPADFEDWALDPTSIDESKLPLVFKNEKHAQIQPLMDDLSARVQVARNAPVAKYFSPSLLKTLEQMKAFKDKTQLYICSSALLNCMFVKSKKIATGGSKVKDSIVSNLTAVEEIYGATSATEKASKIPEPLKKLYNAVQQMVG